MARPMTMKEGVSAINREGCLLVFPVNNAKEPHSLWTHFYPRKKMLWEWSDEDSNYTVADLWHLRMELSTSRKVVYAKWWRGRATFFSRPLFAALVHLFNFRRPHGARPSSEALSLFELLEETSPLSTKELKKLAKLEGRFFERTYEKALKELWSRLLVVGFGERDDGAFPSLVMGATRHIFEELWDEAEGLDEAHARALVEKHMPEGSLFRKQFQAVEKALAAPVAGPGPREIRGFSPFSK